MILQFPADRCGRGWRAITVRGNPPVKFRARHLRRRMETTDRRASPSSWLGRRPERRLSASGVVPSNEGLILHDSVHLFLAILGDTDCQRGHCFVLQKFSLVLNLRRDQEVPCGSEWGADHTTPSGPGGTLPLLRAGLLLRLVQAASGVLRRNYPLEFYPAADGM